jgi:hypothetical protein
MGAFERIGGELGVVERLDLERLGDVTGVAFSFGRSEPELPRVNVAMTTRALARRARIRRSATAQSILLGRGMTAVTRRLGMGAGQRPCAVVDARGLPAPFGVAIRAPTGAHLVCELRSVRIFVAIDAGVRGELEVDAGPFALMTAPAGRRLMLPLQGESRAAVLLDAKQGRPEPVLVVTGCTIHFPEGPAMGVAMAVGALIELELPETAFGGKLG